MILFLLLVVAQAPVQAAAALTTAPVLHLHLIRDGRTRFHIEAEATVPVSEKVVWDSVRDYDHMTRFIPMLVVSRRTVYQGRPAIEQVGRARLLFLHFDARAILEETFDPVAKTLELRAVDGDFVRFDSFWRLQQIGPNDTAIALTSEANLKRWVPQWLARWQVRKSVDSSLRALLAEMDRRAH